MVFGQGIRYRYGDLADLAFNSLWELDGVRTSSIRVNSRQGSELSIPCGN